METVKVINGFTQVSNAVIMDTKLTFKAKGIYLLMLSRPPNWVFNVEELASNSEQGLKSLRSGLKELRLEGYVALNKEYDKKTRKFQGTRYTLTDKHLIKNVANRERMKTNVKTATILESSENDILKQQVLSIPKSTAKRNTRDQQQSIKDEDRIATSDISCYLEEVVSDRGWLYSFLEMPIAPNTFLDQEQIQILLQHFVSTSLQAGNRYASVREVKIHFTNWLNKNKSNNRLMSFIQEGKINYRMTQKRIIQLLREVELVIKSLEKRAFENVRKVLDGKLLLIKHSKALCNLNKHQLDPKYQNHLDTIEYWIDLVDRAQEKDKLIWFCQINEKSV